MKARPRLFGLSAFALLIGCLTSAPVDPLLLPEQPMVISFSDGSSYPASGVLSVRRDPGTGEPLFTLNVTAITPGDHEPPAVGAVIAQADVLTMIGALNDGGADVEYGTSQVFAYTVGDGVVHRTTETMRMWVETDATVHVRIRMGAAVPYGGPALEVANGATADLVGDLLVACSPPGGAPGFIVDDPTWSSSFCAATREEFGLDALIERE